MHITFTTGDVDAALDIMREAGQWQIDQGCELWLMNTLTREYIQNPPEEFLVAWAQASEKFEPAACCLLSYQDPIFWPDVPAGTSGFLHKVAVRRKFARQGIPARLIQHAEQLCREKNITTLRLDTDFDRPKLRALYERLGFMPVGTRVLRLAELNMEEIEVVLFEKTLI